MVAPAVHGRVSAEGSGSGMEIGENMIDRRWGWRIMRNSGRSRGCRSREVGTRGDSTGLEKRNGETRWMVLEENGGAAIGLASSLNCCKCSLA